MTRTYRVVAGVPSGSEMIARERARQIAVEHFTPEHDAQHTSQTLVDAAEAYLVSAMGGDRVYALDYWPWESEGFKPTSPLRDLVKAGALIAAAIDKIRIEGDDDA